ncbi:serine protease snake-like [Anopheles ziemanni]|uniref:serine protease snake-like n=1 Tax=Anopheles ziemanni TaxID=345580 RepID=UPI00265FDE26|nr:serine protease snake-like [Anopheles ziemanni]
MLHALYNFPWEYQNVITVKQAAIFLSLQTLEIKYDVYNCTSEVKLIVGGEEANYGEFPHQAMLGYPQEDDPQKVKFLCGGTLISEKHVLTAAHCFAQSIPTVVRLGEYNTKVHTGHEVEIPIDGIRKHPEHRHSASYHDIALIRLNNSATLSKHIRPACLWDSDHRNTTTVIATGFGREDFTGKPSTVLRKVQLVEYPIEDCAKKFRFARRFRDGIIDGQMCVGSIGSNITDTCGGDSGGPLQVLNFPKSCTYHVVGITSVGNVCGIGKSKAIYTKVAHYIDWIEDNVWGLNSTLRW